jgi:putative transposase
LRHGSGVTDAEWANLEPLLPAAAFGRKQAWPRREIVNAIFDVLRGGIPRRTCAQQAALATCPRL